MKRRALSWFMAAALGVGTMAGGIGSANIVLAEEQKEETEAADETSEEPADETGFRQFCNENWGTEGSYCNGNGTASGR